MTKPSGIDQLNASVRESLDAKLRGGVSVRAATAWLVDSGFNITGRQVRTYSEKEKVRIESAKSVAEINVQAHKIAKAEGIDLGLDFMDRLDYLYSKALEMVTPDVFASMRPQDILNSSNRYAAVKIQAERFKQEQRDRIDAELQALRSDPDIDEATLDKIEQRIYGVY